MSDKDFAKNLIDQIPDSKMVCVIDYLREAVSQEDIPNAQTLKAMEEMENGGGILFTGSTAELLAECGKD